MYILFCRFNDVHEIVASDWSIWITSLSVLTDFAVKLILLREKDTLFLIIAQLTTLRKGY